MYKACIPYGGYWCTPFAKWQGSFANLHSVKFAAHVAAAELDKRNVAPDVFDYGVLGISVPQKHSFYGTPWLMGLLGAPQASGPTVSQACATSVRCLADAAQEIETGLATAALTVTCDRTSNGPHVYYPNPAVSMGHVNIIWQGDANSQALRALHHCTTPASPLNVSGAETVSIRDVAEGFARRFGVAAQVTGEEQPTAWLVNTVRAADLFGYPVVPLERMIAWTGDWVARGQASLGKATHFEQRDGTY